MNVENDFLTDFDLFGKIPEFYYKGRSKKSSIFGIILTIIYIILYITFLIYKLVRMFKRTDVTFYDSYTFKGLPSIKLTNNEFYGGFGMGGIVDERMYHLDVYYVSKVKVNGQWKETTIPLKTDICQLEWFGPNYREIFSDQPLSNYYCIKDVSGMVLEGYSNLERFSYFRVLFYPCHNTTKDGRQCYDYLTQYKFFASNIIELKIQDNDLNPEDYKTPVIRRQKDMNSPVFKDLFQLIYSYLQIVNIETDEDITGLNFFTDHIRKEQYMKYESSFLIASPLFNGDILQTGGPVADVYLQLAAKVLTQKRQYTQLIDVLGDVGGLMEILYTFLNLISSFVTEILYDRSLVNDLFSFDLNKKTVVLNKNRNKAKQANGFTNIKDLQKYDSSSPRENIKDLENNKNINIYSNENLVEHTKNTITFSKKKIKKKSKSYRSVKGSQMTFSKLKDQNSIQNENVQNVENKSPEDNKNIMSIDSKGNELIGMADDTMTTNSDLKKVYINNWFICCFWCTSRKSNVNKVMFEEGSKLLTQRLDILNMFHMLYNYELIEKHIGIQPKEINMSDRCKRALKRINANNKYKNIDS